jgi:amino acid permease
MVDQAPAFLQYKVIGVPYAAVGVSALLGPLAYMTLGVGSANVFPSQRKLN